MEGAGGPMYSQALALFWAASIAIGLLNTLFNLW